MKATIKNIVIAADHVAVELENGDVVHIGTAAFNRCVRTFGKLIKNQPVDVTSTLAGVELKPI